MKLLFDQNISFRILSYLKSHFPNSTHIKIVGLYEADDKSIWDFAKKENYIIVSQDSDFNDLVISKGFPPKLIWFKTGNMSTSNFSKLLIKLKFDIIEFANNETFGIFEIHKSL